MNHSDATPRRLVAMITGGASGIVLVIAHGWRQQALVENVDKIRATGLDLYSRLLTMSEHFMKLGETIEKTVAAYNQTVGSLERNVLPSARKFKELRPAKADQLEEFSEIESGPRTLDASKWQVLEAGKQVG